VHQNSITAHWLMHFNTKVIHFETNTMQNITSNKPYPKTNWSSRNNKSWEEFRFTFKTMHEILSWRHYFLNALHTLQCPSIRTSMTSSNRLHWWQPVLIYTYQTLGEWQYNFLLQRHTPSTLWNLHCLWPASQPPSEVLILSTSSVTHQYQVA